MLKALPNGRAVRIVGGLGARRLLLETHQAPELVSEFVREFHRRRAERSRSGAAEEAKAAKRVAAARAKVERLVRAVTDGGAEFSEIRDALAKARQELAQAETAVSEAATSPVIALHPGLATNIVVASPIYPNVWHREMRTRSARLASAFAS